MAPRNNNHRGHKANADNIPNTPAPVLRQPASETSNTISLNVGSSWAAIAARGVVPSLTRAPPLAPTDEDIAEATATMASMPVANDVQDNASIANSTLSASASRPIMQNTKRDRGGKGGRSGRRQTAAQSTIGGGQESFPIIRHCGPLMVFSPFPRLPAELRCKIWRFAMTQPRLIEMEWGPSRNDENISMGTHQWHRVSPRSRIPPAVFWVNAESRAEATIVYTLRTFDSITAGYKPVPTEKQIYFNDDVDILFFGEHSCITTLMYTPAVQRIAIHMSGKIEQCCDHDDQTYGVDGGVDTMQALHGFDPEVTTHSHRFVGVPGLKEVMFVVKSRIWPHGPEEIDDKCILFPTDSNGITPGQGRFKWRLLTDIALVELGQGIYVNGGKNIWVGNDKPTFSFASIRPITVGNDLKVCDGIAVSKKDVAKLRRKNWEFLEQLQRRARCDITVLLEEYRGEDPREIALVSDANGVAIAKAEIFKFLGKN
ncbi:hypothetical protein EG329_002890 [Mollisiaceae sp. DMI_Dod_QoI]|nr:hypothetical protein EG329_002890 [Helotiales sp. DMI_Dod_QoI]